MATNTETLKMARNVCEELLSSQKSYNIEKSILPSEVEIIDRLLNRSLELENAYAELHTKLNGDKIAIRTFFDLLESIAAHWNPQANQNAREGKVKLAQINREIATVAETLAKLLNERTELKNYSGFSCDTFYHPLDVIHAAAQGNYSYEHWVKEGLEAVRMEFDLKYWPSPSQMVQVIADDAARADPIPHDTVTEAGSAGQRGSLADSFKAFFAALEESSTRKYGLLPDKLDLTDQTVADLMSCALGLDPDKIVDAAYVKRFRQRQRERT